MADKEQIGLTQMGETTIARLLDTGFFSGKDDAARFALAFALRSGERVDAVKGASTTWHTKGFDSDGHFRTSMLLLFPDLPEPYRAMEAMIDLGLQQLETHMDKRGGLVLSELVSEPAQII